jgi:hypothetical protein
VIRRKDLDTSVGGWLPAEPAAPTSFSRIGVSRNTMTFSWEVPINVTVMLLGKSGATISPAEANMDGSATSFTGNSLWTSATEQGLNASILYMGSSANVTVTGLTRLAYYSFALYTYSGSAGEWNFNVNELTLLNQRTSF